MKLISTNAALRRQLSRLIEKYQNISFGVAWASSGTEIFSSLIQGRRKLRCAVIGTHFFQTHPDVLDEFVGSKTIKFVLQTKGVFHPKVFVFWDQNRWEILLGSANLTSAALNVNTEISVLISHEDGFPNLKDEVLNQINGYAALARTISEDDAINYRRIWKLKQTSLRKLEGQYGNSIATKGILESTVMSMDWEQFYRRIQRDNTHGFVERCQLLRTIKTAFENTAHYKDMDLQIRLAIAGLISTVPNSLWFGSMRGVGYFYQAVNQNNPHLSRALDEIPLTGIVTKNQYDAFLVQYLKAFPNGRAGVPTASRLLALKRPDTFVCVDKKNQSELTKDFGIKKTGLDYDRYWNEIIERIMDCPWWSAPESRKTGIERDAWDGRAAMLDAVFYKSS